MSSISKFSSRSSSSPCSTTSGFSSITNSQFVPSLSLQTLLDIKRTDINARTIFCGEQDCRLNELRNMTGAIIDLNVVQQTKCPFERVNWTISHRNVDVRNFVLRRLNYWMQQTQIICDMAYEDALFQQENSDKSAKRTTAAPPPSSANFGRRNRTRSLTCSTTPNLRSHYDSIPTTPSNFSVQRQKLFSGLDTPTMSAQNLSMPQANIYRTEESVDMTLDEINQLMESAKWAGVLSDTTDHEMSENRVCFADTVSLSKFAEMLRQSNLQINSKSSEIIVVIQRSGMNVKTREQLRQFDSKSYWFYRVILDNHIQFPAGISQNADQARKLAYQHMIDVCLSNSGVKMTMLTGKRVKVVKGPEQKHRHADDSDLNATYISTVDLSYLSNYNMIY